MLGSDLCCSKHPGAVAWCAWAEGVHARAAVGSAVSSPKLDQFTVLAASALKLWSLENLGVELCDTCV